jgi:hypothetical protein
MPDSFVPNQAKAVIKNAIQDAKCDKECQTPIDSQGLPATGYHAEGQEK